MRKTTFSIPILALVLAGVAACNHGYQSTSSSAVPTVGKAPSAQLAFPGAEGCAKFVTGGRGGKVLVVTNLNDSGPGSFREAVDTEGPRTIVFAVAGTIALQSPIRVRNSNLTIAGQTAPGDGICIKNYNVRLYADNIIIRYMRFRLGDEARQQDDALSCIRQKDILIDHCSFSWSTDECLSIYDTENLTVQWCIISESLNNSVHEKGAHGYGGIWGGNNASFHHNLFAHHSSRNPRFCGSRYHHHPEWEIVDFRNNVIFNWGHNSAYAGEQGFYNMVNNYYKAGPATSKKVRNRIMNPFSPFGKFYVAGNYVDGFPEISQDNWAGGVQCDDLDSVHAEKPFSMRVEIPVESAKKAYDDVLEHAGAVLHRDALDARIIQEVRSGKPTFGDGIIDTQATVGGWPDLRVGTAPPDRDFDGMPDSWEKARGLNPEDDDSALKTLETGYTNLEVYLNELVTRQ
ncbi:MAG: pectate lyase [Lewinellaceae bacterium]|nr:pectate lyase [Saprospiraceae bacterium]MCB9330281.1 pectate lyase [Lewinellaceae bacterium]